MVTKKIIKKGSGTLTGVVISMLIVIAVFLTLYNYINYDGQLGGVTLDAKYNETYGNLTDAQNRLDDNIGDLQDNLKNISEADDTFQVAWNGLKGLGNLLLIPINLASSGVDITNAIEGSLDIIPTNIKVLIELGIIVVILFIVIAVMKGEPKMN